MVACSRHPGSKTPTMTLQIDPAELRRVYEGWNSEEIISRLNGGGLEPGAQRIARQVLSDRGVNPSLPPRDSPTLSSVPLSERNLAGKLWDGRLVKICQLSFILPAWLPIQHALDRSSVLLGALWLTLLALFLAYGGYRIGYAVTRSICANVQTTYRQKKRTLWLLLGGVVVLYFFLFALADVVGA